jgi:hypothetical protein
MFRRRKKKNSTANGSEPGPPPRVPNPDTSSPVTTIHRQTKTSPFMTDAFKGAMEKAAEWPISELTSGETIKPMAFFVHVDGVMKAVYLSLRDEYHKESLIRRIREKALAENAFAVIILTEMDNEGHTVVLSGVSPGMKASARVNYDLDNESKTVTSWKINWLNQTVRNVFIDDIFDTAS